MWRVAAEVYYSPPAQRRPVGLQGTTPLGTDALATRIARAFEALG